MATAAETKTLADQSIINRRVEIRDKIISEINKAAADGFYSYTINLNSSNVYDLIYTPIETYFTNLGYVVSGTSVIGHNSITISWE